MMAKMGRPALPKGKRLSAMLQFRMTNEEYRAVCAAARKAGLSVSDYARKKLLE